MVTDDLGMRSQRLLSCLLLLQGERRRTARDLAGALEVSTRTVYRDVEALSAAGVPVTMERGPHGGIVLADDYRRSLAQFTVDELQALFATSAGPMADLGIASHGLALDKLAGALPPSQRRAAIEARGTVLIDSNRWYRGAQPTSLLGVLRGAAADARRVRVQYRDRSGALTDRLVDPLGLVAKAGIWYLVAREDKGYRTFRAERIAGAQVLAERFTRPPDFDLDAHWRGSIASLEDRAATQVTFDVVLAMRPEAVERHAPYLQMEMLGQDGADALVRLRFPMRELAIYHVLALGADVRIVEPYGFADAIVACARAAIARLAPA
jgi:predicted DNA-binding transcriptional regulator YafY